MMGADVLANLVSAAHAKELYVILDMNTAEPECWAGYGADAVTVCPYGGSGCLEAGEMLPIAAVRTGGQVQSLVAGDRALAVRGGADGTPGCSTGCVHGVQSGCEGRAESMSGGVFAAGGLRRGECAAGL